MSAKRRWPKAGWVIERNGWFVRGITSGRVTSWAAVRGLARVFPRKWQAELVTHYIDNCVLIRTDSRVWRGSDGELSQVSVPSNYPPPVQGALL